MRIDRWKWLADRPDESFLLVYLAIVVLAFIFGYLCSRSGSTLAWSFAFPIWSLVFTARLRVYGPPEGKKNLWRRLFSSALFPLLLWGLFAIPVLFQILVPRPYDLIGAPFFGLGLLAALAQYRITRRATKDTLPKPPPARLG